jgi:hypothetical protein
MYQFIFKITEWRILTGSNRDRSESSGLSSTLIEKPPFSKFFGAALEIVKN